MKKIFQSLPLLITVFVCCNRAGAQSNTILKPVSNDARITRMNEKEMPVKSVNTALAPTLVNMPGTPLQVIPKSLQPAQVTPPLPPASSAGTNGIQNTGTLEPAANRLQQEQVKEPPVTMPAPPVMGLPAPKIIKTNDHRPIPILKQVTEPVNRN